MPELPEVETIKRDLKKYLLGAILKEVLIVNKNFLTKNKIELEELQNLKNSRLFELERRGKMLALIFEKRALIFHLGLTGALIFQPSPLFADNKHLIFSLLFDSGILSFQDIRKFGKIWLIPKENLTNFWQTNLGPDALEITEEDFITLLKEGHGPIKALLLNQKKLAGLGNIYATELLFRAKIHPLRKAESLTPEERRTLYREMKALLQEAIALRGSSVRDYVDGLGQKGLFQEKHLVYGKRGKPCPLCQTPLEYIPLQGRGTTFCPQCQK